VGIIPSGYVEAARTVVLIAKPGRFGKVFRSAAREEAIP